MSSEVIKIRLPDTTAVLIFAKANNLDSIARNAITDADQDMHLLCISPLRKDHIEFIRGHLPDKPSYTAFNNRLTRYFGNWQKAVDKSFNKTVHPWVNKPSCS